MVSKVAAGAAESQVLVQVTNLVRFLEAMKTQGIWLVGTDDQAKESLYEVDLTSGIALVLGAEGEGLRRLTSESCDHRVSLPMHGAVSSLNVAVATGICLYECLRQRSAPGCPAPTPSGRMRPPQAGLTRVCDSCHTARSAPQRCLIQASQAKDGWL